MFIAGGSSHAGFLSATEYFTPGQNPASTYGPELPYSVVYHCMVAINDTTLLLTGGVTANSQITDPDYKSWFLDLTTETWVEGPQTAFRRLFHTCGKFTDWNGREIVVVAGLHPETELLYLDEPTQWIKGMMKYN